MPDSWAAWETTPEDDFLCSCDRFLLKSPLADAPQVNRYTLLIRKLGTEIVALTLQYTFDCATIVADSAIELYEICLPHTYILCSFALFVYPFPLFLPLIRIVNCAVVWMCYRFSHQIYINLKKQGNSFFCRSLLTKIGTSF